MGNYGLIIRHLRTLAGLSVRETARKINRSVGWLSEIENGKGTARLSESEFDRIVETLEGQEHRAMFRTWVATQKRHEKIDQTFDGAVLKHIRLKKGIGLSDAAKAIGISTAYLSRLETGVKRVSYDFRKRIMHAYGYSPSSFKNLNSDPTRSKAVPLIYKLEILLNSFQEDEIEAMYEHALKIMQSAADAA